MKFCQEAENVGRHEANNIYGSGFNVKRAREAISTRSDNKMTAFLKGSFPMTGNQNMCPREYKYVSHNGDCCSYAD